MASPDKGQSKAAPRKPTPTEVREGYSYARFVEWMRLAHRAVVLGAICFCAYCVYLCVEVMAGKSTDFRSVINWGLNANLSEWAAWALVAIFGGAWFRERRAR